MLLQLRGRIPKRTVLTARVEGALSENDTLRLPFSAPPELTLPALLTALRVGAHDPRVAHLYLRIGVLACGWGKLFEVRRHLEMFRSSGKAITVFMEAGGAKEFFLAMGFGVYVPPEGGLGLRGFVGSGTFVGGVLEKIGVEPQVERIGKYKSAGDQLTRRDMSSAQREVLEALLGDVYEVWMKSVCEATGTARKVLEEFLDRSPWGMEEYLKAGLISGICYESELLEGLKKRFRGKWEAKEDVKGELKGVDVGKYVRRTTEKLVGIRGRKRIAVIRVAGAITGGKNGGNPITGSTVGSDSLVELIRKVRESKKYVACLLRCDSPGGSALASDIVWNELRRLAETKPLLASQSDVAASGGYYLSMASEIITEPLTITGSIGVIAAKPSLSEFYKKVGYGKENVSIGSKYAELLVDDRIFTEEEGSYFKAGVEQAYKRFVAKAALSRGKSYDEMEEVAQGRVWTGLQAKERGLVDYLGGIERAVEILKEKTGIPKEEYVRLETMRNQLSLAQRLGLGLRAIEEKSGLRTLLGEPLALADVDVSGNGVLSPLSAAVIGGITGPLTERLGFVGQTQRKQVMEAIAKLWSLVTLP